MDKMILYDSPEAAEIKTITGWVSRNNHYWGNDEHMARYDGCTHRKCETCGEPIVKNSYCRPCYDKKEIEKFKNMERKPWDGKAFLYSHALDGFIWSADDLDYLKEENDMTDADLMLVFCEPRYSPLLDPDDFLEGVLADECCGYDIPEELLSAFNELNQRIKEYGKPLSWIPGKFAVAVDNLGNIIMEIADSLQTEGTK